MSLYTGTIQPTRRGTGIGVRFLVGLAALLAAGILVWQIAFSSGLANLASAHASAASGSSILDIGVLVFREGLECILVLAAITASMTGEQSSQRRPVATGAGVGAIATLITWFLAVRILNDLSTNISALKLQAATGLLAIIVLLIVMNWFFHKMYWTGWISLHNRKKRELIENRQQHDRRSLFWGLGVLGFSSFYREGFEVVLFLQSYRLKLGGKVVFYGVLVGLLLSAIVAVLTFVAHHKLPYRKMLVLTGVLLGGVLLVMVGEQVQEMELAHWLPSVGIRWLAPFIPAWMGLWFSVFPDAVSLAGQAIAFVLVLGSYYVARGPASPGSRGTPASLRTS